MALDCARRISGLISSGLFHVPEVWEMIDPVPFCHGFITGIAPVFSSRPGDDNVSRFFSDRWHGILHPADLFLQVFGLLLATFIKVT